MLLEHERYDAFGMDALVSACSWNTSAIFVLAWICHGFAMERTSALVPEIIKMCVSAGPLTGAVSKNMNQRDTGKQ